MQAQVTEEQDEIVQTSVRIPQSVLKAVAQVLSDRKFTSRHTTQQDAIIEAIRLWLYAESGESAGKNTNQNSVPAVEKTSGKTNDKWDTLQNQHRDLLDNLVRVSDLGSPEARELLAGIAAILDAFQRSKEPVDGPIRKRSKASEPPRGPR